MISKLNKFLHYLEVEKGLSRGTIEAYRLDLEKGLIAFLHQRGKYEVGEVTKADIRDYLDYTAASRGNSSITRARKLAAIKSFFNYLVENDGHSLSRRYVYGVVRRYLELAGINKGKHGPHILRHTGVNP